MAQSQSARPRPVATPAKAEAKPKKTAEKKTAEKKAEAEEKATPEKRQPRRFQRVSRNPTPPPRRVLAVEEEEAPKARPEKTEVAEGEEVKKRGGPFSLFGKIFGGRKNAEEAEAESTEVAGPPAPTPAPKKEQPKPRTAPRQEYVQEVDDEAHLPSAYQQRQPQAPPVAVHRTVSNARGEMIDLHDDLPSSAPQSAPVYVNPTTPPPAPPPQQQLTLPPAPATAAATSFNRERYRETRKKAAEDPAVAALGEKLNATTLGEKDHEAAARAYTTALFEKMRTMDPEQADWITRMEAATIRRIEAGQPVIAE